MFDLEVAAFRDDDQAPAAAALLACPECLSGEVEWRLAVEDWDAQVQCACRACGARRVVWVDLGQALTLHLSRPASTRA